MLISGSTFGTQPSSHPPKAYNILIKGENAHPVFKKIWSVAVMLRYKIFFWLLLHDRVNTRGLLRRKSFHLPSYMCELYNDQVEESAIHLFWDCPFALRCWDMIIPLKQRDTSVLHDALLAMDLLPKEVGLNFITIACWQIWMQRNDKIFRDENTPQERSSSYTT